MQILYSSQAAYTQMRQDALTSTGFSDGKDSRGNSVSATDRLVGKLAENIPGMSLSEMKGLDANNFTPEKVASRISGFVAQGLENARARGASDATLEKMYQDALSGVEKGFKDAEKILNNLDMLTPEISSTISETKDLTFDALKGIAPGKQQVAPVSSKITEWSGAERYSKAETFSLEVMTQEGDKVTVNFSNQFEQTESGGYYSDGKNTAVSYALERNSSSNYSFSVEGDLNADELDALTNMVQDISLVADDFYKDGIASALKSAADFKLDSSQLKNMNVTMTRSSSHSSASSYSSISDLPADLSSNHLAAASSYKTVEQIDDPIASISKNIGQLINAVDKAINDPVAELLQDASDFGADLLNNLLQQDIRYKEADGENQKQLDTNMNLLHNLISGF